MSTTPSKGVLTRVTAGGTQKGLIQSITLTPSVQSTPVANERGNVIKKYLYGGQRTIQVQAIFTTEGPDITAGEAVTVSNCPMSGYDGTYYADADSTFGETNTGAATVSFSATTHYGVDVALSFTDATEPSPS
jgi:hypothetical protein